MNSLVRVGLSLLPEQKQKILKYAKKHTPNFQGKELAFRLANNQLTGPDELMLPQYIAKHLAKSRISGRGAVLRLDGGCMKCNQEGGQLGALLSVLGSIGATSLSKASKQRSKADNQLDARLKYLQETQGLSGRGMDMDVVDPSLDEEGASGGALSGLAVKYGKELGKVLRGGEASNDLKDKSSEFLHGMMLAQKSQKGNGLEAVDDHSKAFNYHLMQGEGAAGDFLAGFKYGFFNPIQGIELVTRELINRGEEPKKKKKKGRGVSPVELQEDMSELPYLGYSHGADSVGSGAVPVEVQEDNSRLPYLGYSHGADAVGGSAKKKLQPEMLGEGIRFY